MTGILRFSILFLLFDFANFTISFSQQEINYKKNPVTFSQYLSGVVKGNMGYIAAMFDISITEAELKASKVFPDPEISILYSNNEDRKLRMGQSVETGIIYQVNLGNKRMAGMELARTRYELSQLVLEAYFQNLRADAAISYFECVRDQKIYMLQEEIYKQLSELAKADSLRLIAGEATVLDALQSSLEARLQKLNVLQSFSNFQNSLLTLRVLQGKKLSDTLDIPIDTFPFKQLSVNLNDLINNAVKKRADLLVAIKNKEVAEKNLNLLKANRAFEFSLETGYSYNSISKNEIAPAPAYNSLSAGISFPVKFSNFNRGPLQAAEFVIKQSQIYYEEAELQIISEVIKAYNDFITQSKTVENYKLGLIEDAGRVLQGRIYSYQRGESGLIDVLNAQRTYIELQLNYLDALFQYTRALIELERAAGIWDIS
ncbi:MAG TPA: TolC family protein [Bacteroidales bacterium]|nr:TolC family protein [Bacteroidales bacterium]HQK70897.1 TolC family protein [Bacteroidales bacterium]